MAISMDVQKPVRLAAVVSKSFNAFGRQAVSLITISVIAHLPGFLWFLLWPAVDFATVRSLLSPWADLLVPVVSFMCAMIGYGAIICRVTQDLAGHRVSIAETVAVAVRRLPPLVGVLVAVVALIRLTLPRLTEAAGTEPAGGRVLFGLIATLTYWLAMAMYFVAAPVCIDEQIGLGTAVSRCRFLTKGHRWQIFGAFLLVSILEFATTNIGAFIAAALSPTGQLRGATSTIFYGIWSVLGAFSAVMAAVFYERLRSTKDGVHLSKIFD